MALVTVEAVKSSKDRLKCEKVSVPEWATNGETDCHVFVKQLQGRDAGKAFAIINSRDDGATSEEEMAVSMCLLCACDAKFKPMFTTDDKLALLDGPLAPVTRCAQKALELNGLTEEAQDGMEKNSKATSSDSSPSS